jgi:hypothetical protein
MGPQDSIERKIFESRKDDFVKKVFQFSAICMIGTALAWQPARWFRFRHSVKALCRA